MVGTFTPPSRSPRLLPLLPLLAALVGCVPDLSGLDEGEDVSGDELSTGARAGAGGATVGGNGSGGLAGGGAPAVAGNASGGVAMSGAPSAGTGGAAMDAPKCVPRGAEVCDGEDDDCNGVVDEGCPSGLSTVFDRDLAEIGDSQGGSKFADDCADGSVLTGVALGIDDFLGQVQGVCRKLQLERSASATSGYIVKLVDDAPLAAHPETTDSPVIRASCNENETLVAIRISQQHSTLADGSTIAVIPQVTLSCAKLVVSKQGDDYAMSWEGKREMAPVTGTYADGTAWFAETFVPDGTVATRLGGASGAWIDRLALGVSNVVIARAQ
jgi:hypothetical protein